MLVGITSHTLPQYSARAAHNISATLPTVLGLDMGAVYFKAVSVTHLQHSSEI